VLDLLGQARVLLHQDLSFALEVVDDVHLVLDLREKLPDLVVEDDLVLEGAEGLLGLGDALLHEQVVELVGVFVE